METYWEKKIYIKVNGLYVEKVGAFNASLSTHKKSLTTLYSEDKKETEHYVAENIQDYIKRLERLGFKREEITIESEVRTTDVKTEKVEIMETEVDGKRTLSLEKPVTFKIGKGSLAISDMGNGITFANGIYATGGIFSNSIITDPPHIHPDTEELNEYDIVKFGSYFPHMNVKSGDLAVVVKVYSDNVMVKKDGSTFPISRHHIKRVKN